MSDNNVKGHNDKAGSKAKYRSQMRLTMLSLLGELPNFFALLFSAIGTKAVLVYVDLIDTGSNLMRNSLVAVISSKLRKDLRFKYNYGVGKIEAMVSLFCDFFMVISLMIILGFAIHDLIDPRPAEDFMLFVVCVKLVNITGDVFVYWRQRKICKGTDNLVFRSSLTVAMKNLLFDLISFGALVLMTLFGQYRLIWYVSPVASMLLGGYLLVVTVQRLRSTVNEVLDRSTDEETQQQIMRTLTRFYDEYESIENIQSRISGNIVMVDLTLGFSADTTYEELQALADQFAGALSEKIPKCKVTLRITGRAGVVPDSQDEPAPGATVTAETSIQEE